MDPDDPFAGLEEGKAEAASAGGGAVDGMDEDNPDPRQMGRLMRRMCELTRKYGRAHGGGRAETGGGADPDALEESMGDAGDEEGGGGPDASEDREGRGRQGEAEEVAPVRLPETPNCTSFPTI